MSKVIVTAEVQDSAKWKREFRTHGDLFREYTATQVNYTATGENEVAIVMEVKDVDKLLELMAAPATVEAMGEDGVKRETVKTFVLTDEMKL